MRFLADLHIHSRFSRATSKGLDFVALHRAALDKGIGLVGTGDFIHPGWKAEICEQLEPAEHGLFRLRPELERAAEQGLPAACSGQVRFLLEVEISNIYKRDGRVRKNHNLVYVPSLEVARELTRRLEAIGNVASDGRPILGLDARDLLEMTLEADPLAFLVPAHIWTPWFSMLGSKSGFDSVDECFGDLAGHVFAAETGLSSDPPMNWRLTQLDRLTLVSNSDAHSAAKLGREANLLDIELSYQGVYRALRHREGFLGTVEFYPEEGKYHLDGHRKCGLRLEPEQTREHDGRCPRCGGKLTVGVMSRVLDLADRPAGHGRDGAAPFERLVPLAEVVGQVLGVGPQSKSVAAEVGRLLAAIGPELVVLREAPVEQIARVSGEAVAEAVRRVRCGELEIAAGFDGEFGTVSIFAPGEQERLFGQLSLLAPPSSPSARPAPTRERRVEPASVVVRETPAAGALHESEARPESPSRPRSTTLDPDQRRAVETRDGPLLVVAGPGAGKTRTVVARIARQVETGQVRPDRVLAITFTNQAAAELGERIAASVAGATGDAPLVTTFHGLGRRLLAEVRGRPPEIIDDEGRLALIRRVAGDDCGANELEVRISLAKQCPDPESELADEPEVLALFRAYQALLEERGVVDVDDLVLAPYRALAADPELADAVAARLGSVAVDEYQDVNDVQAALVELLCPGGATLCAIGDPDQAIYGFRGARPGHFRRFAETFARTTIVRLGTTYRMTAPVLAAATAIIGGDRRLHSVRPGPPVEVVACATAASEAEQILLRLERLIGGTSHFAVDSGRGANAEAADVGFGDIAVLVRTRAQRGEILTALGRSGIPCRAVGEHEAHDPRSEKVVVMTMHAAKGREYEVVFVTGVEEGLLPLDHAGLRGDPEEERRLLYVALTRARQLAVISHAARRTVWGKKLPGAPSRFLASLPDDAVLRVAPNLGRRKPDSTQMRLF